MMKKFISLLLSVGFGLFGQAHAQTQDSFEREFVKFDKDFERLNTWKAETPASKKLKHVPTPTDAAQPGAEQGTTTPIDAAVAPATDKADSHPVDTAKPMNAAPDKSSGLPAGAKVERLARSDRLGYQISDPEMRKKVQALYRRPDVVVQQYVLPTN